MSRDHEILLPLANPDRYKGTHLQIEVKYDKGGMCFGTYRNKPRGYYLSVGTIGIWDSGSGIMMRSFGLFSHPTVVLEEAARLNRKRLDQLFASVREDVSAKRGKVWELITQALAKHGRELADNSRAAACESLGVSADIPDAALRDLAEEKGIAL